MIIKEIDVKTVLSKSNLPVSDYAVNPYVGCLHACKYCYASFMKRFTNHPEPWGTFLDVKSWPDVKDPSKYKGKELFLSSVTDPYQPHEAKYKRTRAIIERAKGQCNLVWLENLNLRGDYRPVILDWIHENHPELDELYHQIYSKKDRSYWTALDQRLREYTAREGMVYVRDDDSKRSDFGELPVVANYFYHEEVKKSAKKL